MSYKLSIIIVNYNGKKFIKKCLESINLSEYKNYEIIIVDNASQDNSIELVIPQNNIKIIKNKKNVGFSEANNQAVKISKGDYLFFLNNDTKIKKDTISNIIIDIDKGKDIFIRTCKIFNYTGDLLFHSGIGVDVLGYPVNKGKMFYGEGSALIIKKDIFLKIGGFDSSYFMFHEDIDLAWRAWLFGYQVKTVPNAIIYHYAGGSAGGRSSNKNKYQSTILRRYFSERNNIKTLIKNYSLPFLFFILPLYLIINIFEMLLFLFFLKRKMVYYYIKAYSWNLINIKDTLIKRKYIQKNRVISDFNIISKMYHGSGKLLMFKKIGLPQFK